MEDEGERSRDERGRVKTQGVSLQSGAIELCWAPEGWRGGDAAGERGLCGYWECTLR